MLMTPKRIVHEGGVVARDAFESKGINDRLGLKPILLTLESDHDVLLAQDGAILDVTLNDILEPNDEGSLEKKSFAFYYDASAALYHCKQLANSYAVATSQFAKGWANSGSSLVYFSFEASPYFEFDALVSAARRAYDKSGHIIWQSFGDNKGGMPNNFADMLRRCTVLSSALRQSLETSWTVVGSKLKDYRDCTQHFASIDFARCNLAMSKLDENIWSASAMIPDNPEVKSKEKLSYNSRVDALSYGWQTTAEVIGLAAVIVEEVRKKRRVEHKEV